jgi:putative FmdB family regulatory protein
MPTYAYECPVCHHKEDQVRVIAERDQPRLCPECLVTGKADTNLVRDVCESMRVHTDMGYQTPIYSDAAGVDASQVPEMRRQFPNHEYTDDGRMVFRSHTQREKALKEIGFVDRGRRGWF